MKFDRSLPIKERLEKRRKRKRARFRSFIILIALLSGITGLYIGINRGGGREVPALERDDSLTTQVGTEETSLPAEEATVSEVAGESTESSITTVQEEDAENDERLKKLKIELEKYCKQFKGQYGIYYWNLSDGKQFGIHEKDRYTAASTVKIPINLYLYNRFYDGSADPKAILTYQQGDYEGGAGELQYKKVGTRYSLKELSRLSIEFSDNVAVNMLLRYLGRPKVKNYMREVGGTVVSDKENISCPRDMALYMKKVYEFSESAGETGKELLTNFFNTRFSDRLPKLLPKGVKIAHKTGNWVGALHDVGIIFTEKPYILAVMSRDVVNDEEACNVIANISKKVYDSETAE
jgi:beta-lactamase class A